MSRKITELLKCNNSFSYSLEVTQDISEGELRNLVTEKTFGLLEPLFYSVTWHAQTHRCEHLDIAPIKVAKILKSYNKDILLHLTCSMLTKNYLDNLLKTLKVVDICNLFVIAGESLDLNTTDFKSTQELIKYIKQETGDYFCIGIAGFPGHDDKLSTLKEKIDSGGDFIVTQAFFEYDIFMEFMSKCDSMGIGKPIIPGIFPFETKSELSKFVNLCKVDVSENFIDSLKVESGLTLVEKLINAMIVDRNVKHYHFFTLNKIMTTLNLTKKICEKKKSENQNVKSNS